MFDEIDARAEGLLPRIPSNRPSCISRLVTLAIAILLAGLLLPAMQTPHHGRSRQLQCASNLRQLGFGVAQYVNQYGHYPPGTIPNPDLPLERRLGWGSTILPYIDMVEYLPEHGLTEQDLSSRAWDDPALADLTTSRPGITRCPETFKEPSFVAIAGLGIDAPTLPIQHRRAGIFGDDRRVTPADIKDGLATTMMLAESDSVPAPWFAGGRATVRGLDPFHPPYLGPGRQFGGNHKKGANVLMADGSVKFIPDSVDPKIFEAMSTIAGGEKASDRDEP